MPAGHAKTTKTNNKLFPSTTTNASFQDQHISLWLSLIWHQFRLFPMTYPQFCINNIHQSWGQNSGLRLEGLVSVWPQFWRFGLSLKGLTLINITDENDDKITQYWYRCDQWKNDVITHRKCKQEKSLYEVGKKCTCWATWRKESMWHSKWQVKRGKSGRNWWAGSHTPASRQIT